MNASSLDTPDQEPTGSDPEVSGEAGSQPDLIEAFLSTYERRQTRKSYGHDLRDFFGQSNSWQGDPQKEESPRPVGWEEALACSPEETTDYLRRVAEEKGMSAARRRRSALRAFFRWLKEVISETDQRGEPEQGSETEKGEGGEARIDMILGATAKSVEELLGGS